MQRIVFVDIAKAICIMLVVVGHYVPDGSPGWYVAVHDVIYTFHMPLFMFASDYVYMATRKDAPYGGFLLKKARRLMVPYLATSAIVITVKMLSQGGLSVDNPVTPLSYLRMLYRPEAGAFLWFIWALWWMFVVVPLLRTKAARLAFFIAALALHYIPLPPARRVLPRAVQVDARIFHARCRGVRAPRLAWLCCRIQAGGSRRCCGRVRSGAGLLAGFRGGVKVHSLFGNPSLT